MVKNILLLYEFYTYFRLSSSVITFQNTNSKEVLILHAEEGNCGSQNLRIRLIEICMLV